MSLRLVLAASATLAFAAPAFAQDAPPARPAAAEAPAPAPVKSAEEVEMEARAEAFQARMTQMGPELEAAVKASGGDQTKGMADIDAVLARYQPDIESFASALDAFFDAQIASAPDDATREQMTAAKGQAGPMLRAVPEQIRAQAAQAITAQGAPAAPSTPQ